MKRKKVSVLDFSHGGGLGTAMWGIAARVSICVSPGNFASVNPYLSFNHKEIKPVRWRRKPLAAQRAQCILHALGGVPCSLLEACPRLGTGLERSESGTLCKSGCLGLSMGSQGQMIKLPVF